MRAKSFIKKIFNSLGFELKRYSPASSHELQTTRCLDYLQCDLVLDVGANKGQFASELRNAGYKKRIVSFEPLSCEHDILKLAAQKDPLWDVFPRGAIGNQDGDVDINVSENSVSSSILDILPAHVESANQSQYVRKESVPIRRLDSIANDIIAPSETIFLKIDTQGFEKEVLAGAKDLLKNVSGVLCELSMQPLYEGQALWEEIISDFKKDGFMLWAIQPGFTNSQNGQTLQFDGIFVRKFEAS